MRLSNTFIFFIILLVGGILRFWDFAHVPFSHDEFSALFRTEFSSFADLIEQGVKPDGHPAGIQVFLYYWTSWFGYTEWVVKLPFASMGLASVWLVYLLGTRWYNETAALLSAACMACLQYPIVYSVTARPYISGLFFSLAMVWFWTSLVKQSNRNFYRNGIFYILFAALCAYNHYFSLLFAAIVGVSGLFVVPAKARAKYMVCGVLVFLLFSPHLSLFFSQLSMGGVEGWLAKPEPNWLWVYVRYVFHYSWWLLGTIACIVVVGFILRKRGGSYRPYFILSIVWFLLPFLIGFVYSLKVNAVLQYSVLIFSFPYLLFLLFGHFNEQKPVANLLLVCAILVVGVFSLLHERKHIQILYRSHYEHIVKDAALVHSEFGVSNFVISSHPKISEYYIKKNNISANFTWADSLGGEQNFRAYIKKVSQTSDSIYFGTWASGNENYIPIIKEYYPREIWYQNYGGGSTHLFAQKSDTLVAAACLDFSEQHSPDWGNVDRSKVVHNTEQYYVLDSTVEWSPGYEEYISNLTDSRYDFIDISVFAIPITEIDDVSLVKIIEADGKVIHWSNVHFNRFVDPTKHQWQKVHHSIRLANIIYPNNAKLKVFVWNNAKQEVLLDDIEVKVRPGNNWVYGLRDEF